MSLLFAVRRVHSSSAATSLFSCPAAAARTIFARSTNPSKRLLARRPLHQSDPYFVSQNSCFRNRHHRILVRPEDMTPAINFKFPNLRDVALDIKHANSFARVVESSEKA